MLVLFLEQQQETLWYWNPSPRYF